MKFESEEAEEEDSREDEFDRDHTSSMWYKHNKGWGKICIFTLTHVNSWSHIEYQ